MPETKKANFSIKSVTAELCKPESYNKVYLRSSEHDIHMPSVDALKEAVELLRSIIFPGYYIHSELREETMDYYIGATLDKCFSILTEQLKRGYCFACDSDHVCNYCEAQAESAAQKLLEQLG